MARAAIWICLALIVLAGGIYYALSGTSLNFDSVFSGTDSVNSTGDTAEWWQAGREGLQARLDVQPNLGRAKNVILFVGDGMGMSTVTAGRIYEGQEKGMMGEGNSLSFESFPHIALSKTYNTTMQVPQSAATATAMNTGIKTTGGVIGVGPEAGRGNCVAAQDNIIPTMGELAEQRGMATGVVTTTTLTHATPAAVYAHSAERSFLFAYRLITTPLLLFSSFSPCFLYF